MIPLKTIQGLSKEDLYALIGNKKLYIWGGGFLGEAVLKSLQQCGITPVAFLDNRAGPDAEMLKNFPVINSDKILAGTGNANDIFIIIASSGFRKQAEQKCLDAGLKKKQNFITYLQISRPAAVVDVSGMCNLRCPSCPQGNMTNLNPQGNMSFATYKKVLNKLMADIPLLTHIELFSWGEPFLNPELAKIISLTEKYVQCSVSTGLHDVEVLEDVIKAQPSQLAVTMSGYGKYYEKAMKGASWSNFLENLNKLSNLVKLYKPRTRVIVKAYNYKFIPDDFYQRISKICRDLDLTIQFEATYLNPYDNYLDYCLGNKISTSAEFILRELPWDVDKALELAKRDINLPCLSQRIFPIINWDLSVSLCHTYYHPVIADNYLNIGWNELLKLRHSQKQCLLCQEKVLHRLDLDVLSKRYPDEIKSIYYGD